MSKSSAVLTPEDAPAEATSAPGGPAWWLSDAWEMAKRNLRRLQRTPELIMYAVIQPIVFVALFVFVLGGAISVPDGDYTQFLMPGIVVQMVVFAAVTATAVGVSEDMRRGLLDRFRSIPMARSAVLVGRTMSEIVRNVLTVLVVIGFGLLVGFRFYGGIGQIVAALGLLLLFGLGLAWLAAVLGLLAGGAEGAQQAVTIWVFPFTFISSVYVPTASMPGWLQAYANHSPMTVVVDTVRAWFNGQPAGDSAWQALAWSLGLLVVFAPIAVRRFVRWQT